MENEEATYTPEICIKSEEILQKNPERKREYEEKIRVENRLFELGKKKNQPFKMKRKEEADHFFPKEKEIKEEINFIPKINKKS